MPPSALALVIVAAIFHAAWNFIIKKAEAKQIITFWALIAGALISWPLILPGISSPAKVWPYILGSALAEVIYFLTLLHAYERADFSLTYPIARGAAPALIAFWSMLFMGEHPEPAGIAGIVLILFGLAVVGSGHTLFDCSRLSMSTTDVLLALGAALMISIYSVIDAAAVRMVSPLPYLMIVLGLTGIFMTPIILLRYGFRAVVHGWRTNLPQILAVALLSPLAYLMVLKAYAISSISYVGAIREVSIVFAAIAGWRWLGEAFGKARTIGAILIFIGILTIAIAG